MWLAIETSGDVASVAVGIPGQLLAETSLAGARRHAAALPGLIDDALGRAGASRREVEGIVLADGPGGFTGLRIGATVAKALLRVHPVPLWVTPALHALAVAHIRKPGEVVVALGDALRGEVYATAVRDEGGRIAELLAPSVFRLDQLPGRVLPPDRLVVRPEGPQLVPEQWLEVERQVAAPSASQLLALIGRPGGVRRVSAPDGWEPDYGRPAEAQAKWEASHGRRLPDSPGQLR